MAFTRCHRLQNKRASRKPLNGHNVATYRQQLRYSQNDLAEELQVIGLDVDKNAIQRIECGKRFVTDIELQYLAKALHCGILDLLK